MPSVKGEIEKGVRAEVAEYQRPHLADAKKVARILDVSEVTVYRMARAGTLPAIRIGTSVRFNVTAIERWIEAQSR